MSLRNTIKNSSLSLKGVDLEKRDGKAIDALKGSVANTPLSMKGKTPEPTYEDSINAIDPKKA